MKYIAMGFNVNGGTMSTINSRNFPEEQRNEADRQFHLYCAAAATSANEVDTAVLMTDEGAVLERKTWIHTAAAAAE